MANSYWVGGTGTWDASDTTHWSASTGGAGGQSVPGASDTVILDASSGGGTVTVNTDFSVVSVTMGAFTGTLDFSANNNSPTMQTFNYSGTGTRTLKMGSGTLTITGNAGTIWQGATSTGLTFSGASLTVNFTYSGSTGTRTLTFSGANSILGTVNFSAGSDAISQNNLICSNLSYVGYTGALTLTTNTTEIRGNFILGTGMSVVSGSVIFYFTGTSSYTITTNGVQINCPINFNGVGGTWTLQDDLDMSGASARTLTLTNGTLITSNHNVTCDSLVASGAGTRGLLMDNTLWTITGSGTSWNIGTSTPTFSAIGSIIKFTDNSNNALNFYGRSLTYNNVWFSRGASTGAITIGNGASNTFNDFKDDGTAAHSLLFTKSTTNHIATWNVNGAGGGVRTILDTADGAGTFTLNGTGTILSCDWLDIRRSTVDVSPAWYAGANSLNTASNTNWIFTVAPVESSGNCRNYISNSISI